MSAQGIEILKIFRSKVLFLTMAADLANHELEAGTIGRKCSQVDNMNGGMHYSRGAEADERWGEESRRIGSCAAHSSKPACRMPLRMDSQWLSKSVCASFRLF